MRLPTTRSYVPPAISLIVLSLIPVSYERWLYERDGLQVSLREGNVQAAAGPCLKRSCDNNDQAEALKKVEAACRDAGIEPGGGGRGSNTRIPEQTSSEVDLRTSTGGPGASRQPSSSTTDSASATPSSPGPGNSDSQPTPAPAPPTNPSQPTSSSTSTSDPEPPLPTDTPLALLPPDRQLSTAAKAGIGLSVSLLFTSILVTTALYIRRLKRDLAAAQAAAQAAASSIWDQAQSSSTTTNAAPAPLARRQTWRDKTKSPSRGRSPPLSPVSPMRESPQSPRSSNPSLSTVLLKKKRGPILSVVVEAEESSISGSRAGSESASTHRFIREPVVGQMEGLVDPLELDGVGTVVWEMPVSITPRGRSLERGSEGGRESSDGRTSASASRSRSRGERRVRFGI